MHELFDNCEWHEEWHEEICRQLNEILIRTRKAGQKFGLPERFLDDLLKEVEEDSDWSFVIKAHALMETVITHVLSESLHITGADKKVEISDFIARLPMNGQNGKVSLAESLNLITKVTRNFIWRLGEIRNFYVHDLRNVGVTLEHYIFELKKNRKHEFYTAFFPGYPENKEFAEGLPRGGFKLYIMMGLCANLSISDISSQPPPTLLDNRISI
jgi:hypothetical protein